MKLVMAVVVLAACGSKSSEPAAQETKKTVEPAKVVAAGPKPDAAAAKPAKRPPPTKEQLAEFKKRMKAGWALQKATKWAESVPEFEAALVAVPSEQRALAELGWSAMNAGDFAKARKADEQAIKVAVDKKVRASGLYNLGLVQEKTGDKDGALKSFLASLQLRPNKTVEQAVGRLGAKPETETVFCATGAKPCDCVFDAAYDEIQRENAKCDVTTTPAFPVKTFKLYHVSSDAFYGSQWTYALDEKNQLVGVVEGDSERGHMTERTKLVKADLKAIGGHYVLWLETEYTTEVIVPTLEDSSQFESTATRSVTLCVVGDGKTATRCPLREVPLSQVEEKGTIDGDASPAKTETVTEVTIADDGTATVKLVRGPSDAQIAKLVGPHKLW